MRSQLSYVYLGFHDQYVRIFANGLVDSTKFKEVFDSLKKFYYSLINHYNNEKVQIIHVNDVRLSSSPKTGGHEAIL